MKQIKLNFFVAGSKDLEKERNTFRVVASELQTYYEKFRKVSCLLNIVTFENFSSVAGKERKQAEYNCHIQHVADVVFFVFDAQIGGITREEFDIAKRAYLLKKRPQIGVFTKITSTSNTEIDLLKDEVNEIGQYWIDYKDDKDLRVKIKDEISKLIDNEITKNQDRLLKRIAFVFVGILILGSLIWSLPDKLTPDEPIIPQNTTYVTPRSDTPGEPYTINYTDDLATKGYMIVSPNPKDQVKYYFTTNEQPIDWSLAPTLQSGQIDTLYPKSNGYIYLYAQSENCKGWQYSAEFNYGKFVETAILSRDQATLKKMFDEVLPLVVHLPGDVIDTLRTKPVATLYDYLNNYNYHIESVESASTDNDITSNQYGRITNVKLTK